MNRNDSKHSIAVKSDNKKGKEEREKQETDNDATKGNKDL